MTEPIRYAELDWDEQGLPVSRRFGDVYFSTDGGLAESRHVFLDGNHLTQRLAQARRFTIGETGFGSGLNFLALWQLWLRVAPAEARLHFFSAEKYPLRAEDMARIHALFPEVEGLAAELRAKLPMPSPGFHRVHLAGGRIFLTLMYGDALEMFREQEARADAWFLDGFAPRLNPELWSAELAKELARLSHAEATIATFSTSSTTQASLAEAGFTLEKRPGFGRKKHMLCGYRRGAGAALQPPAEVHISGAGLAGASVARALAMRGVGSVVYDPRGIAACASANPSAIFYPGVSIGWQAQTEFYYMGYGYSRRLLMDFPDVPQGQGGMLLFPKPHETQERLDKVMATMQPEPELFRRVDAAEASAIAGIPLREAALHFPANGWVDLGRWTQAALAHPLVNLRQEQGRMEGITILCQGWEAETAHPALRGQLHPVRGQVSCLPSAPPLADLRAVLCFGGYITPAIHGRHHLGATYGKERLDTACEPADHAANRGKLTHFLGAEVPEAAEGWAALRSVSRDRLPLLGRVEEGVYTSLGHASRGLLSCALSGEYLASLLLGEPLPLPRRTAARLNPWRFTA